MAKSVNKVIIVGNLGKDVELKYTPNGTAVAKFTIATSYSVKDKQSGEWRETTEWHNVVAWQRTAEVAGEYLKKGSKVYVEGRLQTRSWDDKQTGQKKYMTEVICEELVMMGGASGSDRNSTNNEPQETYSRPVHSDSVITDDDIPF